MFSKIAETGIRVPRNTHAPLTLPGILCTAGHCDQLRFAISCAPSFKIIASATSFCQFPLQRIM